MLDNLLAAVVYLGVGIGAAGPRRARGGPAHPGPAGVPRGASSGPTAPRVVLAAALIGQGLVIFTAIWTNAETGFGDALLWTVAFGLLGVVLTAVAFMLVDVLTPGRLGEILARPGPVQPVAIVTAAAHLAVAAIVVASIA